MEAAASPVGVAAVAPEPVKPWPHATAWTAPTGDLSVRLPSNPAPTWSRSVQGAAASFLLLNLALLGWYTWNAQQRSCRPTALETRALPSPAINLNEADHAQLLQLPGVGESLAQRIEHYRAENHGFRRVDELRRIPGVGPALLEKLRPFVYVQPQATDEAAEPLPATGGETPKEKQERSRPEVRFIKGMASFFSPGRIPHDC